MNVTLPTAAADAEAPLRGRVALVTGSTSGSASASPAPSPGPAPRSCSTASARPRRSPRPSGSSAAPPRIRPPTKPAEIEAMIGLALDRFGRLDVLVNNAGIQHVSPIESFAPEKWDAVLAINLSSAFHTIRLALPAMRRQGGGRIINVASAHALVASPFKAAYVAAKHGVVGLTKVVALEAAEDNVTCNAICPGYVYTPLVEAQIEGQAASHGIPREQVIRDVLLAQQPNKRFATVEEIGALALFLASDASASITGAALPVDGGWTAH